jgi:hypothetical protein
LICPKLQIFSDEEIIEDPIKAEFFCAMYKALLSYDKRLEAYHCSSCVQWYDLRLQDIPLKDFQLVPYGEQRHYAEFDANDPMQPFVENIPVDRTYEENDEAEIRSYENGRVQRIKVKGTFADAIKFSNILSAKKREEDQ